MAQKIIRDFGAGTEVNITVGHSSFVHGISEASSSAHTDMHPMHHQGGWIGSHF